MTATLTEAEVKNVSDSHEAGTLDQRGLAEKLHRLIYEECNDAWNADNNPEPVGLSYREFPISRATNQSETTNRGWRIILDRYIVKNRASLFIAGDLPDSDTPLSLKKGLKIISATPDGQLSFLHITDLDCPKDSELLSTVFSKTEYSQRKWIPKLKLFEDLNDEEQQYIRQILDPKNGKSGVLGEIRLNMLFRDDLPRSFYSAFIK